MLPSSKFYKQGKGVIGKLLKEGTISVRTYWDMVGNTEIGGGGVAEKRVLPPPLCQ